MDPSLASNVFAIAPTVGLWGQDDSSVRSPHDLLEQKAEDAPIRYIVYSWKTPYTPRQWRQLGRWARRDAQEPKESDTIAPRVSQLAGEWCADLLAERDRARLFGAAQQDIDRVNRKIAERLVDKLREGYEYTLDLSAFAPDVDPVEDFLFNTKRGHCEFFASAMTLMARSLALEARMCGGFLADERSYSKSSGYYLVRASDAHAWVEIYYPSADWVLYDPTPPGSTNEPPGRTQRLRHFWDDIHFLWRTRIIGYGEAQRQGLFGTFLDRLRSGVNWAVARLKETAKSVMDILRHGPDRALLLRLLPGLSLVLAGSALVLLAIELWRRHRRKRRMLVRPHHAPRFYRRLHRLLERRGVDQRLDQTPREYLVQAAKELHLSRPLMGDLADMLYTSRWGERPLTEEQVCQAEDSVKQVAVQLKRR
jgi:transglutaminase-like putative cysteine protease